MTESHEKRPYLTLVVSGKNRPRQTSDESAPQAELPAVQLTLFPGAQAPTVIYVHPTDRNVNQIIDGLRDGLVHGILDIRETPYLTFHDMSRESFLKTVSDSKAEYVNVYKLMRGLDIDSIKEFFKSLLSKQDSNSVNTLEKLKTVVKHGPVFVFSDREPEEDDHVASLEAGLRGAKLDFSPCYLRE